MRKMLMHAIAHRGCADTVRESNEEEEEEDVQFHSA